MRNVPRLLNTRSSRPTLRRGSSPRATQVVAADSFQRGHIIERLAQDVRALELFAGRTEALRAAVAEEVLPHNSER